MAGVAVSSQLPHTARRRRGEQIAYRVRRLEFDRQHFLGHKHAQLFASLSERITQMTRSD
jgi:hypothetical protein